MPLHEWTGRPGWEGMRHLWICELLRWVKPRLPAGYRAFIGSAPVLAIGAPMGRQDVGVQNWPDNPVGDSGPASSEASYLSGDECAPEIEIAVATLDPNTALWVEKQGRLIAAVE